MKNSDDRVTLEIFIHNLTQAQAIALEDLLATWQQLGSLGSSRWTAFYADGDGSFRPTCVVNGHVARHQAFVDGKKFWRGDEYRIDFDAIGWALRDAEKQSIAMQSQAEASAPPETKE